MSRKKNIRDIFYAYLLRRHDDHDPFYKWKGKPFYAGKGKNSRKDRHLKEAIDYSNGKPSCNPAKDNIILYLIKNGIEFEIEVVKDRLTEEEAFELEIELIALYGRKNNNTGILANLTDGGEGSSGMVLSEERLKQVREQLLEIQELAKEWHRSEEGTEWHKEHAKNTFCVMPLITYNCQICGKKYESKRKNRTKFCSRACKVEDRRRRGVDDIIKTCPTCGKDFGTSKYLKVKYCSKECYGKSQRNITSKECLWCKKSFIVKSRNDRKFCSRECFSEYRTNILCNDRDYKDKIANSVSEYAAGDKDFGEKICGHCGKTFKLKNSQEVKRDKKYCSTECRKLHYGKSTKKSPPIFMHTAMHMPLQLDKAVNE